MKICEGFLPCKPYRYCHIKSCTTTKPFCGEDSIALYGLKIFSPDCRQSSIAMSAVCFSKANYVCHLKTTMISILMNNYPARCRPSARVTVWEAK